MKTSTTVIGILGGAAAGALLGILFAPDKGSNTRKKIIKKSTDTEEDIKLENIKKINKELVK